MPNTKRLTGGELRALSLQGKLAYKKYQEDATLRDMPHVDNHIREVFRSYLSDKLPEERNTYIKHLDKLGQLMWMFGDGATTNESGVKKGARLNSFAYDAAMLGILFDETEPLHKTDEGLRLSLDGGRKFRAAIREYASYVEKIYVDGEHDDWFDNDQVEPGTLAYDGPPPYDRLVYVIDLGRHRDKVAQVWRNFQSGLTSNYKLSKLPKKRSATSVGNLALQQVQSRPLDKMIWSTAEQFASPEDMHQALYDINMEAVFIRAIETYLYLDQIIRDLNDDSESFTDRDKYNNEAVFRQVMFAQEVLAPLIETQGFDALAMALDGAAKEIRMNFGTKEDRRCLILARQIRKDLPSTDKINSAVTAALDKLLLDEDNPTLAELGLLIKGDDTDAEVVYGEGFAVPFDAIGDDSTDKQRRIRYRVKTVGSLAWKIREAVTKKAAKEDCTPSEILDRMHDMKQNIIPMDRIGVTIMAQDEVDQRVIFGQMVENALHNAALITNADPDADKSIRLKPAPSRHHAIQIRGTQKFCDDFRTYLVAKLGFSKDQLDKQIEFDLEDSRESVHVAKITFDYTDKGAVLPIELQCVTEEYRTAMRYGEVAHWLYKAGKKGDPSLKDLTRAIQNMEKRKKRLPYATPRTRQSAEESSKLWSEIKHYKERDIAGFAIGKTRNS